MQITTMLAARQNLAVSVAVAMAVTADTLPGGPNDVGRHPQRNLSRCHVEKVGINTCDTCHQQNDELHMNCHLFLRSGRLRQIVVKDVGILPKETFNDVNVQQLHCDVKNRPRPNGSESGR